MGKRVKATPLPVRHAVLMPDLPFYLLQLLLLPLVLSYIWDILSSLFFRLAFTQPANSQDVASVATPTPNSTDYPPAGGALDKAAIPLAQAPLVAPSNSALARTPEQHSPLARSSTNTPLTTTNLDESQHEDLPSVLQHSRAATAPSQQVLLPQGLTQHPLSHSPQPQERGMFYQANNSSLFDNILIDNNDSGVVNIYSGYDFMAELRRETILDAAFDSSARDPPPRCHSGTRLAILERCVAFIENCSGKRKMRWVFGAAGVGKSAIMQSVAERPLASVPIRASIFFFVDGCSDGSKAIVTLVYQLAVQYEQYRHYIIQKIAHNPFLLQKSISVQFNEFFVEPFIHHPRLKSIGCVLILIDGLDKCHQSSTQKALLRLISDFCLAHPSSPIAWMIASRPGPHIKDFFAQFNFEVLEKEEILVDSEEAREDIKGYLRVELMRIKNEILYYSQAAWPPEEDFVRLADASGGFFAFASNAVKYIGDSDIGDPTARLNDVLQVIDDHPLPNDLREKHPMALLDALYSRILDNIPASAKRNARNFLLALAFDWEQLCGEGGRNFIVLCNWLGMTCHEAYAAIRHLSSVVYISGDKEASSKRLRCFHKSFLDYLSDYDRSRFSPDIKQEARQLFSKCTSSVLKQAPNGIDIGGLNYDVAIIGAKIILAGSPGTGHKIQLTWPVEQESDWKDESTMFYMYKMAFDSIMDGLWNKDKAFNDVFFLGLLAVRLDSLSEHAAQILSDVVFDRSCRQESIDQGLLQRIPANVLTIEHIVFDPHLQFHCPTTQNSNLSDPWNSSCTHSRHGHYSRWGEGESNWSTNLSLDHGGKSKCEFCYHRLKTQLESWKDYVPNYSVLVLFTPGGVGIVEVQFVDPKDGISEWTYHFCHKFSKEERKRLGSTV